MTQGMAARGGRKSMGFVSSFLLHPRRLKFTCWLILLIATGAVYTSFFSSFLWRIWTLNLVHVTLITLLSYLTSLYYTPWKAVLFTLEPKYSAEFITVSFCFAHFYSVQVTREPPSRSYVGSSIKDKMCIWLSCSIYSTRVIRPSRSLLR